MFSPPTDPDVRPLDVAAPDGAHAELLLRPADDFSSRRALYWLPALGVPARHYLPLARALAARGVHVALHEWRGIGSSNRRAGRHDDWDYRTLLEGDLPAGLATADAALPGMQWSLGGHSLGGQLACLLAGLHPDRCAALVLVASGSPYWRRFRHGWLVALAYLAAPALARVCGYLPGRRIGFGGNEARGVIADWARSGRSGRYAARGLGDLEAAMARYVGPVLALRMRDDWLGPAASLAWLLGKLPAARPRVEVLSAADLGVPADHFSWMKAPDAVADHIAVALPGQMPADAPGRLQDHRAVPTFRSFPPKDVR